MILKDADSQDIIQMNAFTKHPHEHRSDAELQEDDDQGTHRIQERSELRGRLSAIRSTTYYFVRWRTARLFHLNSRIEREEKQSLGNIVFSPVIHDPRNDLDEDRQKKIDVNLRSTAVQRSEQARLKESRGDD